MSSHATSPAVKPVEAVLHAPPSLPLVSTLWARILAVTQNFFDQESPSPVQAPNSINPAPSRQAFAPPEPKPAKSESRTPAPAFVAHYSRTLNAVWAEHDWSDVVTLVETLRSCWRENRQVFLCGNGGSAANAIHLANDFLYGIDKASGRGLRVTALPANPAVLTCLANDIAYEDVFAQQLSVLASPGDVLIAFSGSGNSPNIVKALVRARALGLTSFAVLGFTGGEALELANHPIYFPVHDMQVAEDLQMMVGHMAMQYLTRSGR